MRPWCGPAAWPADDRQEKVLFSVVLNLLRIRDDKQQDRIRLAFEERQFGILPATKIAIENLDQVGVSRSGVLFCSEL